MQLAFTAGIISLFVFHEPTIKWVLANIWIYYVSIIALVVTMILLACCESLRRNSPVNFILLGILTACMSLMLGVTCAYFETWEVMLAVGITVVVTVSLVIFAMQTKWDFTTMGGILFVGLIVLVILAVFSLIFNERVLTIVYASLGALLFCIYLIYDIQVSLMKKSLIFFLIKLSFLAYDGWQTQIQHFTRGIYLRITKPLHRHCKHFYLYFDDHRGFSKLITSFLSSYCHHPKKKRSFM